MRRLLLLMVLLAGCAAPPSYPPYVPTANPDASPDVKVLATQPDYTLYRVTDHGGTFNTYCYVLIRNSGAVALACTK